MLGVFLVQSEWNSMFAEEPDESNRVSMQENNVLGRGRYGKVKNNKNKFLMNNL